MQRSESIKNIAKALSQFQSEIKNPANTANNPFFKSKYAPLPDILNDVRPLLYACGLSVIQSPGGDGSNISITTLLMHESGEWIETDPLILKADKATAQGAGSAITYARRYAIASVLGISSEDDDDGNQDPRRPQTVPTANTVAKQVLTDSQITRAYALATTAGINESQLKEWIGKKYSKSSLKELAKKEYDELCAALEAKKAS